MKKLLILFGFLTVLGVGLTPNNASAHGYYGSSFPFFSLSVGAPVYAPVYAPNYYPPRRHYIRRTYYRPNCYQPYRHHYRGGYYGYRY